MTFSVHIFFIKQVRISLSIVATLNIYNKKVDSVMAVIGDNENLNKAFSKLLKVPFIGCANHRLNLAVNKFLTQYESLLYKIQMLMVKLSSLKRSAALRKSTQLRPVLRKKTRKIDFRAVSSKVVAHAP